ncbi:MAG: ribosomal protein S18-alanine N-acetyltransferase [Microbacterium sp.]
MTLRTAGPGDLGAIMALERASFPTDAWSEAMMREELHSPYGRYLVVEEHGRLLGYGGVRAVRGAADADIQTLAVADDARGRGRGRALLLALLELARERGARTVFLEVRADNPVAEALYRSVGFVELGRRARYYQPDDVDAVVMKLDLRGWAARPRQEASRLQGEPGASAPRVPAGAVSPCTRDGEGRSPAPADHALAADGGWCS